MLRRILAKVIGMKSSPNDRLVAKVNPQVRSNGEFTGRRGNAAQSCTSCFSKSCSTCGVVIDFDGQGTEKPKETEIKKMPSLKL